MRRSGSPGTRTRNLRTKRTRQTVHPVPLSSREAFWPRSSQRAANQRCSLALSGTLLRGVRLGVRMSNCREAEVRHGRRLRARQPRVAVSIRANSMSSGRRHKVSRRLCSHSGEVDRDGTNVSDISCKDQTGGTLGRSR